MEPELRHNQQQSAQWNSTSGLAWVEAQQLLDFTYQPFEDLLVQSVINTGGARVLDVGCGSGSTTLAIARQIGAHGQAVGIDISEPLIAAARARAASENSAATFVRDDAQTHRFRAETFDTIVSRFGVMFFDDPIGAFSNLARAARINAHLVCFAWRSVEENPFMTTAERAAAPLLTNIPQRQHNAPGQFAFANRERVHGILDGSGWRDISIEPLDVACRFPTDALPQYLEKLGPLASILAQLDQRTRANVVETVRAAFEPHVHGSEVRFSAACWNVSARRS